MHFNKVHFVLGSDIEGRRVLMRGVFAILICGLAFFTGCKKQNQVYSTASFDRAYEYDSKWDYRGYKPNEGCDPFLYRTYQPDPNNGMVKKTSSEVEKEGI